MTSVVRPATSADVPAMVALINAIIAIGGTTAHQQPYDEDRFQRIYLTDPSAISAFASFDGQRRLTGFQVLGFWLGLPDDWGDIGTFVAESARGSGAGNALFAATLAAARDCRLAAINATIRADNALGLGYYSRLGFVDYARDPDFALNDGTRVGRISKRYDL